MPRHLDLAALFVVAACAAQMFATPKPVLAWNVTSSAPVGLWRRTLGPAAHGAWVLVRMPSKVTDLAAARRYLPRNVPMVKQIAAVSGDTVCREGAAIRVNGTVAAMALAQDAKGRALPVWSGCHRLGADEIFLLTKPSLSFDSRYFGAVPTANVIERITPLWTF